MDKQLKYSVQCLRTATHTAPEAIFLFMRGFDKVRDVNCYFWLMQGGGRNILVDTGMGGEFENKLRESARKSEKGFPVAPGEDTLSLLEKHNLRPDDIDIVILTHLHHDHIANIPLFTKAKVIVNRKGWYAAKNPLHPVFDQFPKDVLDYMEASMWDQIKLVEDEAEIIPGIEVMWTGGHTACSQAVKIATERGKVILTGDVAYLYDNLEQNHPIGLAVSLYESVAALKRFREENAILLPGHDKEILTRYPGGKIV
ncbi:MAG TPA: N-acyl homoserine lactonase family protein [Bacilli bacterium]